MGIRIGGPIRGVNDVESLGLKDGIKGLGELTIIVMEQDL